jgi:hypothetical protein
MPHPLLLDTPLLDRMPDGAVRLRPLDLHGVALACEAPAPRAGQPLRLRDAGLGVEVDAVLDFDRPTGRPLGRPVTGRLIPLG